MPTTRSSARARPSCCSTSPRSRPRTCAAAGRARARARCSIRPMTVERIDAIMLAGGSAFGLDAASGAQAWLREQGRGFQVREARVPIVPAAILFDLLNGGDKNWGRYPPYRELGYAATAAAATGLRARQRRRRHSAPPSADLKGGLGSASAQTAGRHHRRRAGRGQCRRQRGDRRRAAFLGGALRARRRIRRARPARLRSAAARSPFKTKGQPGENTTLVVVATDATLTKAQAQRLAMMAQDGMARALAGAHPARRRHRVRRRDRRAAARRSGQSTVWRSWRDRSALHDVVARAIAARRVSRRAALPFRTAALPGAGATSFGSATGCQNAVVRPRSARPHRAPDRRTASAPVIISAISRPLTGPSVRPQWAWP